MGIMCTFSLVDMSVAIKQSPVERTAHSYAGSQYILPSDDDEGQRLGAQHRLYTRILFGRLIFPPVSLSGKDEVLDIGTGTGAWLCDVRAHLPKAVHLYGIDIESRLFPSETTLHANDHFSICSGTDLPSYWTSKFALVHQRLLICAYTRDQWQRNIAEMYRVLRPGGYAQLIEFGPEWVSGPKTAAFILFVDNFFADKGMMWHIGAYIANMLKSAGFVDVTSEEVLVKFGKWAGEDGAEVRDVMSGGFRGFRDSVMKADGLGRFTSHEEYEKTVDEVVEEWDNAEGSCVQVRVCYGRKPL